MEVGRESDNGAIPPDCVNLRGKTALVTGAAKGIGKSIALVLAKYGADIVVADVDMSAADTLVHELQEMGRQALSLKMNVTDGADVRAGVSAALDRFSDIDILVNNAGIIKLGRLEALEEPIWNLHMDVNIKGPWLVTKALIPHLKERGSGKVINISSKASKTAEMECGAYCVSKAALNMLTQAFALELAEYHINVNAVCPGIVDTELQHRVWEAHSVPGVITAEEYGRKLLACLPFKRMARPEEVGELVAFLASDRGEHITGVSILIAGGEEMH